MHHDGDISGESAPWPTALYRAAYHGLAGRIVDAVAPYTEADPIAILIHLLVAVGAAAGPAVRAVAGNVDHPARLFAALVGETSKARKGTAAALALRIIAVADPGFVASHVVEGLSSGEGLIWRVRDANPPDAGVADKRLLVGEAEFARTLRVAGRDGNTLSPVLRRAWDSGNLQVLTRSVPVRATGAHIAVYAHVTREELTRYLTRTEVASGFANEFVWCAVRRAQLLPEGDAIPKGLLEGLGLEVRAVLEWARTSRILSMTEEARADWASVYGGLSKGRVGLAGAVLARSEAQALRLAVAYAILDQADRIGRQHLAAALSLTMYVKESVDWIFGTSSGDPIADRILLALRGGSMDRTQIGDLFSRHASADTIDIALTKLANSGKAVMQDVATGGRPREVWSIAAG